MLTLNRPMQTDQLEIDSDHFPEESSTVIPISGVPEQVSLSSVTLSRLDYIETGSRSSSASRALTLMFFLTDVALIDFRVTLRISPAYPGVIPESVMIPAGSN